jgi:triacylglycerol lipase
MPRHTIILAHGVLGFGSDLKVPLPAQYFNGVAAHLENQGHKVIAPSVDPIGGIAKRGRQFAERILSVPLEEGEKLHVIAYSMGGLDARYALSNIGEDDVSERVAERVQTLVTIGTPHRGSPVADAIANPKLPLFQKIPTLLREAFQGAAPALRNLTTEACERFNQETPDVKGVRYIEVAADALKAGNGLFLFKLAAAIGGIQSEVNDGVVTRSSALRDVEGHEHLEDWPVDHAGAIGWSFPSLLLFNARPFPIKFRLPWIPPSSHLARYDEIVARL